MLAAVAAAAGAPRAAADLDFSVVQYIDRVGPNWLFRSNMPLVTLPNGTLEFAYTNLTAFMNVRAVAATGTPLPPRFYLQVVSFDNILEVADTQVEVDFFAANPALGNITFWPLYGQLEPPAWVDNATQYYYSHNDTALWGLDLLPQRLTTLRAWMASIMALPTVYLVHCEAGKDRTGEFSAGYYITWQGMNVTAAWDTDVAIAGRDPEFMSKNAIQWYCLTYGVHTGIDIGNCVDW